VHLAVIGTGIVGVATAAWAQRDGHRVTFIDPREAGEACSFGNAGSLSPSAVLPVGMPGMWKKVPKWLLDPTGPLVIRTTYLPQVLPWLMRFLRHSTESEVTRIATAMRGLLAPVFDAYMPLVQRAGNGAGDLIQREGCLYVYSSREVAQRWKWGADLRRSLGVTMEEIEGEALFALEPDLRGSFAFGQFAPDNGATTDPSALVKAIYDQAMRDGAVHLRQRVTGFTRGNGGVRAVQLNDGPPLEVDGVVVAAGAWSAVLAAELGTRLPLETQRGYHVTLPNPTVQLSRNVMAVEQNIMVNPMRMGLRLAGTVELAGLKAAPNYDRAAALLKKGEQIFPRLTSDGHTVWMGHRPCFPDSMPVIGRAPKADNVWFGFGHGHVGMCGGASTGRELANLISGRAPEIDLEPFRADRFNGWVGL
jgi:D-amino-acid dehydrogenase